MVRKTHGFVVHGFRYGDNAPLAVIEFVDRDVEAKRKFKKKKSQDKPAKTEEKKIKRY